MRIFLAIVLTVSVVSLIGFIFWEQEWKFSKPTPVPLKLNERVVGDSISSELFLSLGLEETEQLFIHFYNFDCPCSRTLKNFRIL